MSNSIFLTNRKGRKEHKGRKGREGRKEREGREGREGRKERTCTLFRRNQSRGLKPHKLMLT
ncbi:hypothetical protein [Nostoc sp.]|uniref:hypothetical protein n=1 Tax=Nostoc sp. TaxID=1180 RepID=UPI003FA59347